MIVGGSGRLVGEPIMKDLKEGRMALFTIAENVAKDVAYFHSCQAYGQAAEFLSQYGTKGSFIAITGHLKTWKDSETGFTKSAIVADRVNIPKSRE